VLSRAKITVGRASYYTEVVAKGLDDYLSGHGEAPGRWTGSGASHEELVGSVTAGQMDRLFERVDPCHPVTGEPLGAAYRVQQGRDKVNGWDLTLSAPKSFSTLWAVASPDLRRSLDECHSAAVEASIGYLEVHGAFSRRGRGGRAQVDTRGLVVARFDHRTSRAGDPQRHSHLLVSNRVRCLDDQWRAIDSKALHSQLKAAGVIYQSALRSEVAYRLGARWELADANGQADIEGVPAELVSTWSTRRHEVLARATDRIAESEGALGRMLTAVERRREFETATLETRPNKQAFEQDLHERWRGEATDVGHPVDSWIDAVVARGVVDDVSLEGIVEIAIDDLGESRSTWGRPDLVIAVAALLPAHAAPTGESTRLLIESLVDRALAASEVIELTAPTDYSAAYPLRRDQLPLDHPHDRARYSTITTLGYEIEVLDFASQSVERGVVPPAAIAQQLDVSALSDDQRAAVERLVGDGAALSCMVGPAGTGKTTTIAMAAELWRASGYRVRGLAVSAVAAEVLGSELGVQADTVAKLLYESRRGGPARGQYKVQAGEVLIVDEASMLGSEQFAQLTRIAEAAEAKVVAVGDYRQLGAVDAGGLFQLLAQDGRAAELTGVWRFHNEWERAASIQLRDRQPNVATAYESAGRLYRGVGHEAWDLMASRWAELVATDASVVMLAHRTDAAAGLAFMARRHLVQQGVVEEGGLQVGDQTIGVGDEIVTTQNERRLTTDRGNWVRNGDRWTVTRRLRSGELKVTGDRGSLWLPAGYVADHVALGYALTVHKAQGMTVDHGLVLVDESTSAEALYVGMTRGRESNEAFIQCEHPHDDHVEKLRSVIGHDTTEQSALGYLREADAVHGTRRESEVGWLVGGKVAASSAVPDNPEPGLDEDLGLGW